MELGGMGHQEDGVWGSIPHWAFQPQKHFSWKILTDMLKIIFTIIGQNVTAKPL